MDSIVSKFHATSFSIITLMSYDQKDSTYLKGLNWIKEQEVQCLDYLSFQTIVLDDAGIPVEDKLTTLSEAQNPDGGFGLSKNYQSSILDAALVLKALLRSPMTQIIADGVAYIKQNQNPDGGWGIRSGDSSNIYLTSLVLDVLVDCREFDVQSAIDSAVAFLISHQNPDGGFGTDSSTIFETAWAALGFSSVEALGDPYAKAVDFLLSKQDTNGSWDNSSYLTAVTLRAIQSSRADLAIETGDIIFVPPLPLEGDTVEISAIIHNLGSEPAEQVLAHFYDGDPDSLGIKIGEGTIPHIDPSGVDTLTISYYTEGKPGRHFIHVIVDPYDNIGENSEENNHAVRMLRVIGGPDLEIADEDFSFSPPYPAPGQEITLNCRVLNAGQATLTDVEVGFYDGHPDTGGVLIDSLLIIPEIPSLGYASVELKTSFAEGDHKVYVIADPNDKINEIDETNNSTYRLIQIYNWMDLAVYSWGISVSNPTPYDGDTITIGAAIFNIKENTATDVRVRFYDGNPDSGGIQIGEDFIIDTIPPGEFRSIFYDWHLWYIGGKYHYIFVVVDPDSEIAEVDETNNRASRRINILGVADYTGKSERIFTAYPNEYHPLIPEDGDTTRVYAYLFNIGTFPIRGKDIENRYLHAFLYHNHPDSGGVLIAEYYRKYYPFADDSINFYGEWNTLGCAGENIFYLFIDPEDWFSELREDNNVIKAILPVNPPTKTDLAIRADDIIFEPQVPIAGDTLLITAAVRTLRNKSAENVIVQFFDGNPSRGGTIIGTDTIPVIPPLSAANAQYYWDTEAHAGFHDIYIVVDPEDAIPEKNENNNITYAEISIRLPYEYRPKNLVADTLDSMTVFINWQPPDSEVLGYRIFRNDALLNIPFNIAPEGSASASEFYGSYIPQRAIDEDDHTYWMSNYNPDSLWFNISFSQPITFTRISIRWYREPEYLSIQILKDNNWQTVWEDSLPAGYNVVSLHPFYDLFTTDSIRLRIPQTNQNLIGIYELEIYSPNLVSDTIFIDTFLGRGEYCYYATAIDSPLAESPPSNYDTVSKGDFIPPPAPTGLTATVYGNFHVRLLWDPPPSGVFGHRIYLDGMPLLTDTTISADLKSNPEGEDYDNFLDKIYYLPSSSANHRRRLIFSRFSTEDNHDFLYLNRYPEKEIDRFTGKRDSFEYSIDPSYQRLRFVTDCAGTRSGWEISKVFIFNDVRGRSYDHYNYKAGTYIYGVTAVDGWGNESDTAAVEVVISDTLPPSPPTGLTGIPGDRKAILTWRANTEPDLLGYNIYRTDTAGPLNSEPWVDTTYTDTGLISQETYTYYVTALDYNYHESDPSDSVSVTIAMVDLAVNDDDIIHLPSHPRENFPILTSIKVMNMGFDPCDTAIISFYDGHPDTGIYLGADTISVPAFGSTLSQFEWSGEVGTHDIWVKAVPLNIQDFDTTNNMAHKPVKIFPEGAKVVMFDDGHLQFYTADSSNPSTYPDRTGAFYLFANLLEDSGYSVVTLAPGEKFNSYTLEGVDVLILHAPSLYGWTYTSPPSPAYDEDEIDAVAQFVREGGGLFLIGDHTFFQARFDDLTGKFGIYWQGGNLHRDETYATHAQTYDYFIGFFDSTHFQDHPLLEGVDRIFVNYTNVLIPANSLVPVVVTDSGMAPDNMPVMAVIPEDPIHPNSVTGKGRIFVCSDINSFDNKIIDTLAGESNYRIYKGDDEVFAVNIVKWLAEERDLRLPDPALTQKSIEIRDSLLIVGRISEVNLTIYNYGEVSISDLPFLLSLGHPDSNGMIIIDTTLSYIPPQDSISFMIHWRPAIGGIQKLYAIVDHENQLIEGSETNNLVTTRVEISEPTLPDLTVTKVKAEPNPIRQGEIATISGIIYNYGQTAPEFDVAFYLGDPDSGGTFIGSYSSTTPLEPFDSIVAEITWVPSGLEGVHKIFAVADPTNSINEENEDNNKDFTYLEIISTPITVSVSLDDTIYDPNTDVAITVKLSDLGISIWSGQLTVQVEDSLSNLTEIVDTIPITGLTKTYQNWHFMVPVEVKPAYAPIRDGIASIKINFAEVFNQLGYEGSVLDTNSIRVFEFERYGTVKDEKISRLYYHPESLSVVVWRLDGLTKLEEKRYFMIYFDIAEYGPKPASDKTLPQDIVVFYQSGRFNENPIRLIPSQANGRFGSANQNNLFNAFKGTYPVALAIADIDGDQNLDFISPMGYTNLARLYLLPDLADTSFDRGGSPLIFGGDTISFDTLEYGAQQDIEDRGLRSIRSYTRDDTSPRIIMIGKFWDINIMRPYDMMYRSLECADFNNDGYQDIIGSAARHGTYVFGDVMRQMSQHYLFLFLNNGDTTFSRYQLTQIYPKEVITDLDVADFNRDGNPDLLIITWPDPNRQYVGYAYILFGNGDGTFQQARRIGLDSITGQVLTDDFDCDGIVDILSGQQFYNPNRPKFFKGIDDTTFADPVYVDLDPPPQNWGHSLHLDHYDYNYDGYPDLVVFHHNSQSPDRFQLIYYPGNGDGTFGAGTIIDSMPLAGSTMYQHDVQPKSLHYQPRVISELGSPQEITDTLVFTLRWNTGSTPSGKYYVHAITSEYGGTIAEDTAGFIIRPQAEIYAELLTDRPSYHAQENVIITSKVKNLSQNVTYYNLTEKVSLKTPTSDTLFIGSRQIKRLGIGKQSVAEYRWQTATHPPGQYLLFSIITDESGDTLTQAQTEFEIREASGHEMQLSGTIKATPKIVSRPDNFTIRYSVTNIGNVNLDTLIIKEIIVDGLSQAILYTRIDTTSVAINQTVTHDSIFSSLSFDFGDYLLGLYAVLPDTDLTIATGGFKVVDVTPPVIIELKPDGYVRGDVLLHAEVCDSGSGVKSVKYTLDTLPYRPMPRVSGDSIHGTYEKVWSTTQGDDGEHWLKVTAKDYYANVATDSVSFIVDNTPPEIEISGVLDSTYYNTDITPVITFYDLHLDSSLILLNGVPFESGTTITEEGEYTLYAYASDLASNETDTSVFFIIDKTPPLITISGVADSTWYNHPVTPIIEITDLHLDSSYITLNGEPFQSGTTITEEGEFDLYIFAIDMASNTADTSIFFVIDTTPPYPPVMTSPPESASVDSSPITVEGFSEIHSSVTLNIGGRVYETTANEFEQFSIEDVELDTGWNLLKFTARDKANNVSDTSYYHLKLEIGIELISDKHIAKIPQILVWVHQDEEEEFVRSILDSLRVYYQFVYCHSEFEEEFRSGKYNIYLIFPYYPCQDTGRYPTEESFYADSVALDSLFSVTPETRPVLKLGHCVYRFTEELREAINRGDGFIIIRWPLFWCCYWGPFSYCDLIEITGCYPYCLLCDFDQRIYLDSSTISPPDTIPIKDEITFKIELTDGEAVGWFKKSKSQLQTPPSLRGTKQSPVGGKSRCKRYPALILNDYGKGKSVFFDFDLIASLDSITITDYQRLILASISYVLPETTEADPFVTLGTETSIENKGQACYLRVVDIIPYDIDIVVALDTGEVSAQTITWSFELPESAKKELTALLRTPDIADTFTITTEISYLKSGIYHPYDTLYLSLVIEKTCYQLIDQAIEMLDTLSLTGMEAWYRDRAIARLRTVKNRVITKRKDLLKNIKDTIGAIDLIRCIQSIDISEIRLIITKTLVCWEVRWYLW